MSANYEPRLLKATKKTLYSLDSMSGLICIKCSPYPLW